MQLTREYLLWLFHYDRENGKLYWKNHWHPATASKIVGKEAGSIGQSGYLRVGIKGKVYRNHKIIWFLETNIFDVTIDHVDGDILNNKFQNLREVTTRKNCQNREYHRNGSLVGASFHKISGLWRSRIRIDHREIHLGLFNTELEAHQRYMQELKARGLA